jgi:uncharacterized protein involved in exopolysaccharide biosynthesis
MIPKPPPYLEETVSAATQAECAPEMQSRAALALPVDTGDEVLAGRERLVTRLRRIWRRRGAVSRIAFLGFLSSAAGAFLMPREYQAVTRLMPPDQASSSATGAILAATGGAGANFGSLAGGLLGLKSSGALFVGILQSETVEDDIVRDFRLQKVYRDRYAIDARRDLAGHSAIFEDRKSGIITIEVTDSDPAAGMARRYTEELNSVMNKMSTSSARREREFLEERLKSVQSDLSQSEKDWSDFASKNGAIDIQAQGKAMIEGAATLQGRLIAAESELQGLRQIYTEDNVHTRSLRAEVAELSRQLDKIGGTGAAAGTPPGGTPGDPAYPTIRKLPLLGVTYADLYRRTKTEEAVFETLTREYELAKVQEAKETPTVKVLDPARVPEKKSFPARLLIVAMGTSASLVAGILWLLARTLWEEADPQDPRREFALEIYRDASSGMRWRALSASLSRTLGRAAVRRSGRRQGAAAEHD